MVFFSASNQYAPGLEWARPFQHAIEQVGVDYVASLARIASLLAAFVTGVSVRGKRAHEAPSSYSTPTLLAALQRAGSCASFPSGLPPLFKSPGLP